MFPSFLLLALLLLALIQAIAAKSWTAAEIPNPMQNPSLCGRETVATSAVCDPDNILTKSDKDKVEGHINTIENAEVGVLVINKMDTKSSNIDHETKVFAQQVHNSWGIGNRNKQNGVLVFVSMLDRSIFISTGSGVQNLLDDFNLDHVIDNMKPYLREGKTGDALQQSVLEIKDILNGTVDNRKHHSSYIEVGLFISLFTAVLCYSCYKDQKIKNLEKGQTKLTALMKEISKLNENEHYMSTSCPICLEDFSIPLEMKANETETLGDDKSLLEQRGKNAANSNPKRPMALRCGHVFCHSCLSDFLKSPTNKKCPICRTFVREEDGRGQNDQYDSHQCSADNIEVPYNPTQMRHDEFRYRFQRMNFLYPDIMTAQVLREANMALGSRDYGDMLRVINSRRQAVATQIQNHHASEAAARRGSSGSRSSSFGGGFSSGGRGGHF